MSMSTELCKAIFDWGTVVLIGLTFVFGAGALITGNILGERQDNQLRQFDKDLTEAKTKLGEQQERAAAAEKALKGVENTAGAANEKAAKLEKEAAGLTAKNLQLEAMIAPRRLSEGQLKELESLAGFSGRIVQIKSYAMDTEGLVLATQVAEALAKSKIVILDNRLTIIPGGQVIAGIVVEGPDSALVDKLKRTLSATGGEVNTALPNAIKRGFPANIQFGDITGGLTPAATVSVGVKPVR